MNRRELGMIGENTAAEMLEKSGYRIICRNYRCKLGEIDIVAEKEGILSFVEVKMRTSRYYGRPCEAVDSKKQQRIKIAASCYLKELEYMGYVPESVSFDVLEITAEHIKNAF